MSADEAYSAEELDEWYESTVGPLLLTLGRECKERGVPFLAAVGSGEGWGVTAWTPPNCGLAFEALRLLATKCVTDDGGFNVDAFVFALMKRARRDGHSSLILDRLGVPTNPEHENHA